MGKDFIPLRLNGISIKSAIVQLYYANKVIEASESRFFKVLPNIKDIEEVEIGSEGTNQTIFKFKDGYAVVEGTIELNVIV